MGGRNGKTFRKDTDVNYSREDMYNFIDMMHNQSQSVVIDYLKNNPSIILQPLSFRFFIDTSVMVAGLPVTCKCAVELESCVPENNNLSIYCVIGLVRRLAKYIKDGHCEHFRESGMNKHMNDDVSYVSGVNSGNFTEQYLENDCSGIYLLHLAVILEKTKIVKYLLPFCLDNEMFSSIWFTLKCRLSILYLALAHRSGPIISEVMKFIERTEKEAILYFISFEDLQKAIQTCNFDVFETLSKRFELEYCDKEKLKKCLRLAYKSRSHKCLRYICREFGNPDISYDELSEILDDAIKSGDSSLLNIIMRLCIQMNWDKDILTKRLQTVFVESLMDHNTTVVATLAGSIADLCELRYRGYSMLGWANELNLMEITEVLRKIGGFLSRGTKHCGWSAISSVLLMENNHLVENVACLIAKGHDVNKRHADYTRSASNMADKGLVMIDETPFYVALKIGRYDIMGLLLLNGAEPLKDERFLYRLTEVNVRANVFFVLLSYNALKSVPAGNTSLLRFMIERSSNVIATNIRPCFRDLIYLFLETCESLCDEDQQLLNSGNVSQDILDKYHQLSHDPLSLTEICRRRLRCQFGVNYQLFVNVVRDQGYAHRMVDILMYHDIIDKYFSSDVLTAFPIVGVT